MRTLLLHGFTGGAASFSHLGLDAVTPSLPGHDRTPPAASWEDALDRLEPLLDPGPVVLGGYSMGARLALALALRRPEKIARLVLLSGTAGIEDEGARDQRRRDDEELARFVERHGVPAFVEKWERHPLLALPAHLSRPLQEQRLRHDAAGLASALRQLGPGSQPSYWQALPGLRIPALLLAGKRDPKFAGLAARLRESLPQSELRLLDCGHVVHLEQPEAFRGALR